jgi:mRNA-degrading endonuclease RelE of RelBE toxin-antitoxin system
MHGGNYIQTKETKDLIIRRNADWLLGISSEFRKEYFDYDKNIRAQLMKAIIELCRDPLTSRGNTIKSLSGKLNGKCGYRLGDCRLAYLPVVNKLTVYLLKISSRRATDLYLQW